MNERIRELAERCWDERLDGMHFDQEKFAELLIRECAEVAEDYDGAHYVGTEIKQHFGVE